MKGSALVFVLILLWVVSLWPRTRIHELFKRLSTYKLKHMLNKHFGVMYTSSASDKQIWNRYWVIKGLNEVMDVWVSLCRGINCSSSTPFSTPHCSMFREKCWNQRKISPNQSSFFTNGVQSAVIIRVMSIIIIWSTPAIEAVHRRLSVPTVWNSITLALI